MNTKNKTIYKLITIIIILFLFFSNKIVFSAEENKELSINDSNLEIYAESCILMDEDSGKILYNKNGNQKMYPASTTKIITGLLVLDNCTLTDMVNVSYYAVNSVPTTYTTIHLVPGESLSIKDLLYVLMIGSANDAAFVLAEYIANGGNNYLIDSSNEAKIKFNESIAKFSDLMNKKAKEIGCTSTNFVNPNGIHNENHYTTAYDLALIGCYAYKNLDLMSIVDEMSYSLPNTELYTENIRTCRCTNSLLYNNNEYYNPYVNGMKTGYTDPAGYCIVVSAKKDDVNLIAVVLNSKVASYTQTDDNKNTSREADCLRLLNYGFENFSYINLISSGDVATSFNIINSNANPKSLDLVVKDDIKALVKKGEVLDITPNIKISKFLAPIGKGEKVGTITYKYNGKIYSSDLISSKDVYSNNYTNFILILFVIFIFLLLIVILVNRKKK